MPHTANAAPRGDGSTTRGAISGTPRKRYRRTRKALDELDTALHELARESNPCTVRQLYYLAVTRYLCDKTKDGYNLVQRRLLEMRRAQALPYAWITDNSRSHYGDTRFRGVEHFVEVSRHLYHYDYWHDSPVAVEVWVESDSIAGVLRNLVTRTWGLRLHVASGFSSETFLYNAGQEIQEDNRPTHVYVLSDYDPSGVALAEDIRRKLLAFAAPVDVTVERLALNGEQVSKWALPTHPLKRSDRRADRFRLEHGSEACELEAIPPNLLRALVSDAIAKHVPAGRIERARRDEDVQRQMLDEVAKALPAFFGGVE